MEKTTATALVLTGSWRKLIEVWMARQSSLWGNLNFNNRTHLLYLIKKTKANQKHADNKRLYKIQLYTATIPVQIGHSSGMVSAIIYPAN